jgi:hypothetical protein
MEKEFNIYGTITIKVELDVIAASEDEAIKEAIDSIKNSHNLNVIGYDISPEDVDYSQLQAIEYED